MLKITYYLSILSIFCTASITPLSANECSEETLPSDLVLRVHKKVKKSYDSLSKIKYKKLNYNSRKTVRLASGAKVFNFKTGKSFFIGYKLPDFKVPYIARVTSGPGEPNHSVFYPVIMILDENYKTVLETNEARMHDNDHNQLGSDINIDTNKAKYLIIKTTEKALGHCTPIVYRVSSQYGYYESQKNYAHSPLGKAHIKLIRNDS